MKCGRHVEFNPKVLHQLFPKARDEHRPSVRYYVRRESMKTPDFSCERLSKVLCRRLLSCCHRDEVSHLGQPINGYPDLSEASRFSYPNNEIHRNRLPGLV